MLLTFNTRVVRFSEPANGVRSRRQNFPRQHFHGFPADKTDKSSINLKCTVKTTGMMWEIEEKLEGKDGNSLAAVTVVAEDLASNLCIINTLQRLGIDRHFRSEIDTILHHTYRLWQRKERDIISDMATHAMAFRLLRVHGYDVSSEELAPYADEENIDLQEVDVQTVIELYRAAEERIYEEEESLEKIKAWTTTFLKHQLHTNSIPNSKLHKLVELYLKNYHGIIHGIGVRKNLDLYDVSQYQTLQAPHRFSDLCNEDFMTFAREDFNNGQAQNQKELEQLQKWYADCRLDTMAFGRDVVRISHFMASAIISDPKFSDARLALAKHVVLVTRADDFFNHGGSREESYKLIELVQEWKVRPAEEYSSEKVEILYTAIYSTVNELAEKAHVEQGRSVKEFLIGLWVETFLSFKIELDTWCDGTEVSLNEYMESSWVSIGCRLCIMMATQFVGTKLSDEMLMSEECNDLCMHASMVNRLLNDVQTFQKERMEKTGSSVTILVAAAKKEGRDVSEEEAIKKIKEMAEYSRRKLMQIVYEKGTKFPRISKDIFLNFSKAGFYSYQSSDEFSSPQEKVMEDIKSLIYEPLSLPPSTYLQ